MEKRRRVAPAAASSGEQNSFHATAVGELMRGCGVMSKLRALLQAIPAGSQWSADAGVLLDQLFRSLSMAISNLQQQQQQQHCSRDPPPDDDRQVSSVEPRGHKRRRRREKSWKVITSAPYDDGHQWRKYGEKRIHGSMNPRSYYRCTYSSEKGCQACKQVQQKDFVDPPVYIVTYINHHTCTKINSIASNLNVEQLDIKPRLARQQVRSFCSSFASTNRDLCDGKMIDAGISSASSSNGLLGKSDEGYLMEDALDALVFDDVLWS